MGTLAIAVVGASTRADRPSHQAVAGLAAAGHTVWPVHPSGQAVAGLACCRDLDALPGKPDIIALYVNPELGATLVPIIARLAPRLLWLNPGADGEPVASAARAAGLRVHEACLLVALARKLPLLG